MTQAGLKPEKSETQAIVVEEVFPHAPATIWKTLTSGELMGRWLHMTPTGFAAVKGTRFTYRTTPAGAWDGVIHCEVLEAVTNERLAYAWRGGHETNAGYGSRLDTVVTFTLSKVENGTRLRVVHSGFALPNNEVAFRNMSGGWKKVVPSIGAIAAEQASSQKLH
ncbi:MAG: SRPBCC domain-containing protein [Bradyrhizobium sp.]|uniref:SRPBCC family protein n=1 Tax=Bradyrhizobium sp. TaxID=376 RepID=UPI001203C568|nr:SRPBCC domain-containing protein [Bradyrhizobium sp.]THD65450.1 MAG: SRPBCC domain-containing protein [Bradyrhizobium sp.]